MNKKIGLMIPHIQSGGSERVMSIMSNMLARQNDIYFFVFDKHNISYDISGKLIDLKCTAKKNKLLKALNLARRIVKVAYYKRKLKLDVMISFLNAANKVNIYSRGKEKVFISCRGYSNFILYKNIYAKNIGKIDKLIFQTELMKKEFIDEFGVDEQKIAVLSNPFNIDKIRLMARDEVEPQFLNFIKGKRTLITVGSFKKDKGFWHLIKVFTLLWQQNKEVCLVIIGHRGEMENEIRSMAKNSPAKDNILFLGYQQNPFKYIAKSDVFVCTSINEGYPNAIVEALACGIAVVSTNCKTGPREILSKKNIDTVDHSMAEYGVLCSPFDEKVDFNINNISKEHQEYTDAVRSLLLNDIVLQEYKQKANLRKTDFGTDNFLEKLSLLINE